MIEDLLNSLDGFAVIYKLTSPSNKSYIGQSINFKSRYKKYKRNTNSIGKNISNALKKYEGIENFQIEILEKFEKLNTPIEEIKKQLNLLEVQYIERFNTFKNGYNLTCGGEGSFKREVSESTRLKISEANKKYALENSKPLKEVNCFICNKVFLLRHSIYKRRIEKSKTNGVCCSKTCSNKSLSIKSQGIIKRKPLEIQKVLELREQGLTQKQIVKIIKCNLKVLSSFLKESGLNNNLTYKDKSGKEIVFEINGENKKFLSVSEATRFLFKETNYAERTFRSVLGKLRIENENRIFYIENSQLKYKDKI